MRDFERCDPCKAAWNWNEEGWLLRINSSIQQLRFVFRVPLYDSFQLISYANCVTKKGLIALTDLGTDKRRILQKEMNQRKAERLVNRSFISSSMSYWISFELYINKVCGRLLQEASVIPTRPIILLGICGKTESFGDCRKLCGNIFLSGLLKKRAEDVWRGESHNVIGFMIILRNISLHKV